MNLSQNREKAVSIIVETQKLIFTVSVSFFAGYIALFLKDIEPRDWRFSDWGLIVALPISAIMSIVGLYFLVSHLIENNDPLEKRSVDVSCGASLLFFLFGVAGGCLSIVLRALFP